MRNKKGFLLGEYTLKVIVAILCLAFLLYLLFALYMIFTEKKEIEKAQSTLDYITNIQMSVAREQGKAEFPVMVPKNWFILSYENTKIGELQCDYCLCVCDEEGWFKNQEETCAENGICKNLNERIVIPVADGERKIDIGEGKDLVLEYVTEGENKFFRLREESV
jgi:type II secretory pathway pseudopilin PulG